MDVKYSKHGEVYIVFHLLKTLENFRFKLRPLSVMKTVTKIFAVGCCCIFILLTLDTNFPAKTHPHHATNHWSYRSRDVREQSGNRTLPSAIIFGIRKCGTRALLNFLGEHPKVAIVENEVHFFNRYYNRGLEWYREQMPFALPGELTIEKTPGYFITPEAPERVHRMDPSVKLIFIVRDPVTRAISDYTQTWYNHKRENKSMESFESRALDPFTHSVNLYFKPLWVSVYHHHLTLWMKYFPLSQIHIVDGDNLVKDPASELTQVETFLGLDSHFLTEEKFYFNQTKGFYCMRVGNADKCLGDSKGRAHPDISRQVLKKLRHFYKSHNALFFNLIGRTFDWPS